MRRWLALVLVLFCFFATDAEAKKRRKKPKEPPAQEKVEEKAAPQIDPDLARKAAEEEAARKEEEVRVEAAKKKIAAESRKGSKITPGTASRWSNRGAMAPIVSEVPITAELPARAIPLEPGQETPGQFLTGDEELLEARIFFSAYHLETRGQDFVYQKDQLTGAPLIDGASRDIDLFRGRATIAYEKVAGSEVGLHLDLEYRPRANGNRPTDHRINELYISYGLTDFQRATSMSFGVALGRIAPREAGYPTTDGALVRFKINDELKLGAFGGVTGNPYGYNWTQHQTQEISTAWLRAGGFLGYRSSRVFGNAAVVATVARLGGQPSKGTPGTPAASGLDRLYLYVDGSLLATETLNLFLIGWIDIVGGHPFQNVEAVASYVPTRELDMRLGIGRFSTMIYDISAAYSYEVDPSGNKGTMLGDSVIIDDQGNPIVPIDAVLGSAIYNSVRGRVGYRFIPRLEAFGSFDLQLRDRSYTDALELPVAGAVVEFASLRFLPAVGARFRDPELFDASATFTYILDKQSNATSSFQAAVGRGYSGIYAQVDGRAYFGEIPGTELGLDLTYTLPRGLMPGRLFLRGSFRYYRESVSILRPELDSTDLIADANSLFLIPLQESYLGFLSFEWRL
jgi:hypothetical protein